MQFRVVVRSSGPSQGLLMLEFPILKNKKKNRQGRHIRRQTNTFSTQQLQPTVQQQKEVASANILLQIALLVLYPYIHEYLIFKVILPNLPRYKMNGRSQMYTTQTGQVKLKRCRPCFGKEIQLIARACVCLFACAWVVWVSACMHTHTHGLTADWFREES